MTTAPAAAASPSTTIPTITTVAGTGTAGDKGDDGLAIAAQLNKPREMAVDSAGSLYIADCENHRVRKVTRDGVITTVAGTGTPGDKGDDGQAIAAQLNKPYGVAVDSTGSLYITEWKNHRVRKVTGDGVITTVAGTGTPGDKGDDGQATDAQLNNPLEVAVDNAGSLYIADSENHRVRKVTRDGVITTVAGTGTPGDKGDDGPAIAAQLNTPTGVAVDSTGSLYITDWKNHRVRKVTWDGVITTVAGTTTAGYNGDNIQATSAQLKSPAGVAVDSAGSLYITDDNQRVRKVVGVAAAFKNPTVASLRGGAIVSVPVKETKIFSVVSKKPLSVDGQSPDDGALIIQDSSDSGVSHQGWRLVLVKGDKDRAGKKDQAGKKEDQAEKAIEEDEYRIENVSSGKVLDAQGGAEWTPIVQNGDSGGESQRWRIVPVEGEMNQYRIESVSSGSVLSVLGLGRDNFLQEDGTRIVLCKCHGGESQRWQFMPSRRADRKMQWTPWSRWDGRQRWKLVPLPTLQPKSDATPAFSDMKLVLPEFGYNEEAGEWLADAVVKDFTYNQGWRGEDRPRLLVDTTGNRRVDIVAFDRGGVNVARGAGDGTFEEAELVVEDFGSATWTSDMPRFLVDTTGNGRVDIVGFFNDGVWVSLQDNTGKFAPRGNEPVLKAFGYNDGWRVEKHPRFLVDTTGDGRVDIVGCFDDGVRVSLQNDKNRFAPVRLVHKNFGSEQGWTSVKEHPRFLVTTTGDGQVDIVGFGPEAVVVSRGVKTTGDGQVNTTGATGATGGGRVDVDIVGFGPEGVWVARGDGEGGFADSACVLEDFGSAQGWTGEKHLRFLADTTGDGQVDIVGFGDEGVWVSRGQGGGEFAEAELVCAGFGYHKEAGGWRVDRHPRFLADTTGDGRVDILGFGGPGVYVARNLARQFVTR
jgi:Ricin-type beta-trefoil lectin domain-like/NHL repeat